MALSVADLVLGTSFPLYGLDATFTGPRWVRSWEARPGRPATMVSLAHGDPENDTAPDGLVEVAVRVCDPYIDMPDTLETALAVSLYSPDSGVTFEEWFSVKELEGLGAAGWTQIELIVDGRPEQFAWQTLADHWVAVQMQPEIWLYLLSCGTPPDDVALAKITDRQIYIDGSLALGTDLNTLLPNERGR